MPLHRKSLFTVNIHFKYLIWSVTSIWSTEFPLPLISLPTLNPHLLKDLSHYLTTNTCLFSCFVYIWAQQSYCLETMLVCSGCYDKMLLGVVCSRNELFSSGGLDPEISEFASSEASSLCSWMLAFFWPSQSSLCVWLHTDHLFL